MDRTIWRLAAITLLTMGCGAEPWSEPSYGRLGNGHFMNRCLATDDVCSGYLGCVALDSSFAVVYALHERHRTHVAEAPHVVAASNDYLDDDDATSTFAARRPGMASLLAISADQVVDFIDVRIVEIKTLDVEWILPEPVADAPEVGPDPSDPSRVQMHFKSSIELVVEAVEPGCHEIAGRPPMQLEVEDESVVKVTRLGEGRYRLDGRYPGEAAINIEQGPASKRFVIQVVRVPSSWPRPDAPPEPPRRNPPDVEHDTDTDTDVDTDVDTDIESTSEADDATTEGETTDNEGEVTS